MSAKKRKGQSAWSTCDYCNVTIAQKDAQLHKEKSCPPNLKSFLHSFIFQHQLYCTVETYQVQDRSLEFIPKENRNDFAIMPCHVLQLCRIPIGDPVVVKLMNPTSSVPFVKLAWAGAPEKVSDFSIALSDEGIKINNFQTRSQVMVSRLQEKVIPAKNIVLITETLVTSTDSKIILSRMQKQNINKIYCVGNKVVLRHYGSRLVFEIADISSNLDEESLSNSQFYVITLETKWTLKNTEIKKEKQKITLSKLGGLKTTIAEIQDLISLVFNEKQLLSGLQITKGVIIHGPPGTGKSTLIETLAQSFTNNIIRIESSRILSKFLGETEKELQNCFEKAKHISPSIILIDDVDILCTKSSSTSEFSRRISATLSILMDKLNSDPETQVLVLAATSKIHQIDKTLRCPNRFGKEIEIYVPSSPHRYEILNLLLEEISHSLEVNEIKVIADSSHGFVGADLVSLVSKAVLRNYKETEGKQKITFKDFQWALTKVKPSAMKEIMIEVPNVKWSDIAGQEELKLKLRQSVEWPLKYGEAFKKLGITPPKGVLMFGPPGCSKTMIAKALATESNLNFISVKGPELFSKWVGESERAVRKVFRRARQTAPSIVFFDELDAIGGERNISSGSSVQERVLAQLLTELDGVESLDNVTVIAATNRVDRIDSALIRPGRLDRIIYVPLPDGKTRHELINLQLQKMCVSEDVVINELVQKTEGFSGAEIVALCREAALKALEENIEAKFLRRDHFIEAFQIVVPRTPKSLLETYEKYLTKQ